MEQRVNEFSGEIHKLWEVSLESGVDILVIIGGHFKVLFKLKNTRER